MCVRVVMCEGPVCVRGTRTVGRSERAQAKLAPVNRGERRGVFRLSRLSGTLYSARRGAPPRLPRHARRVARGPRTGPDTH
eukprot:458833-Prymnesium_polylepis.1